MMEPPAGWRGLTGDALIAAAQYLTPRNAVLRVSVSLESPQVLHQHTRLCVHVHNPLKVLHLRIKEGRVLFSL